MSIIRRKGRDYKWFDAFEIDNQQNLRKVEEIELYVDSKKFSVNSFHDLKQCK